MIKTIPRAKEDILIIYEGQTMIISHETAEEFNLQQGQQLLTSEHFWKVLRHSCEININKVQRLIDTPGDTVIPFKS